VIDTPGIQVGASHQHQKRRIVFVLLPAVHLLDLAGPAQVFSTASRLGAPYELVFCAAQSQVTSAQGLMFAQLSPLVDLESVDQVIIPGFSSDMVSLDSPLLDNQTCSWLRHAGESGIQMASVCTAAFAIGEAGLLDGRQCTTHWASVERLQIRYPKASVTDNVLFVEDGVITTSAGIASGIDMALFMVEKTLGPMFTAKVARSLVVYARRNGCQPQNSIYLEYRAHLHAGVHRAQDFIAGHLNERITLDEIAQAALLSTRSLSRDFKQTTGLTPIGYQQGLRLELARNLIANRQLSLEEIASQCGFEDVRHFRRLWKARYHQPPSAARYLDP
jgi:transcriptional regulator GlxA family with amidase domain